MSEIHDPIDAGKGEVSKPFGLWEWLEELAAGECCCDEIDPKDKPCLSCEAKDALEPDGGSLVPGEKYLSDEKARVARGVLP